MASWMIDISNFSPSTSTLSVANRWPDPSFSCHESGKCPSRYRVGAVKLQRFNQSAKSRLLLGHQVHRTRHLEIPGLSYRAAQWLPAIDPLAHPQPPGRRRSR